MIIWWNLVFTKKAEIFNSPVVKLHAERLIIQK